MKVEIRDAAALGAVRPADLAAYLRGNGWHQAYVANGRSGVWTTQDPDGPEILVPADHFLADYLNRISDAIFTIAAAEGRSELEILSDIARVGYDVVRVRAVV